MKSSLSCLYRCVSAQVPDDTSEDGLAALDGGDISAAHAGLLVEGNHLEKGLPRKTRASIGASGQPGAIFPVTFPMLQS